MRALILLSHGSRKRESSIEIKKTAEDIEKQSKINGQFDIVRVAFMQFCGPDFYQVVDEIIKSDFIDINKSNNLETDKQSIEKQIIETAIVVFPYFISAGSHVSEDIPNLLRDAEKRYPEISFYLTPHLGRFKGLKELILEETFKL